MSWHLTIEPAALDEIAGFLKTDPVAVRVLIAAIDALEDGPNVTGSHPWGISYRRLRHGPWRVLYRINDQERTIHVEHIGFRH
ncbi:type II toxin-antitoxin system RelE/ParE family toxin [Streptomyces sp. YIM 121038]|uniref:type II toxin-antitoxin system RelE family toxin n=1 Tax=Streptomyces sp. YIM 121038 TaxID=2136401 RepID=UPI00111038E9|nr:type II toxin-antitoxin system RelE/ParE family toxin [Streptomyces sp. YIM 121038]